jgi:endonuclease/exonuclease/phosphatase family metal-dependent hydrolase
VRRALFLATLAILALWWCRSDDPTPPPLRVGTFNIRSFPDAETDLARVAERIAEMDADVFAVQEIQGREALEQVLADASARTGRRLAYSATTYCASDRFRIAVVFDRERVKVVEERPLNSRRRCSTGHPSAHLVLFESRSGERLGFVSTHLKSGGGEEQARRREQQWRGLVATIESLRGELGAPIVVAGDFNSTGWHDDRHGERSFIEELLRASDLRLATAELACTAYWRPPGDDAFAPSMLDHILLAGAAEEVRALGMCQRLRCERRARDEMADDYRLVSDHCPVVAELPRER